MDIPIWKPKRILENKIKEKQTLLDEQNVNIKYYLKNKRGNFQKLNDEYKKKDITINKLANRATLAMIPKTP